MNRAIIGSIIVLLSLIGGIVGYFTQQGFEKYSVVWQDFGTVENLHNVPGWTNIGAIYYQNMTLATFHHGVVSFYTGPGGNMCEPIGAIGLFGSCSTGTVDWGNGTQVFVKMLSGGGFHVGEIQR